MEEQKENVLKDHGTFEVREAAPLFHGLLRPYSSDLKRWVRTPALTVR
jgi:hypothetical protein